MTAVNSKENANHLLATEMKKQELMNSKTESIGRLPTAAAQPEYKDRHPDHSQERMAPSEQVGGPGMNTTINLNAFLSELGLNGFTLNNANNDNFLNFKLNQTKFNPLHKSSRSGGNRSLRPVLNDLPSSIKDRQKYALKSDPKDLGFSKSMGAAALMK